jgi:hypothetical protein
MNERIKELAADARGQMVVLTTVDDEQWRQHEEFVEKFAELIVKECVNVVAVGSFLHDQAPTAIFAKECSAAIKRHFGVEE